MRATPVGSGDVSRSSVTFDSRSSPSASSAKESPPTAPISVTSAPSRAHATAWFAPLPPGTRANVAPVTVSPARGSRSQRATRSRLIDPTTVIRGLIGRTLAYERGGVWGTGRFPTLSRRRGHVGETWFPPRTRAEGERWSLRRDLLEDLQDPVRVGL